MEKRKLFIRAIGYIIKNMKKCRICKEYKMVTTEFHKCSSEKIINGKVYPIVYRSECKKCRRIGGKAHSSAAKKLMKQLNMTRPKTPIPCHCCKKVTKRLTFDHDHTTNKFRGWLCYQCNSAIGNLGDSIEGLTRALEYLKRAEKIK